MTADVRTFRAPTMQAALDIVRREMGEEAVVLHTRQVDKRRLLPFFGSRQEVEITAGLGAQMRPVASKTGTIAAAAVTQARTPVAEELAPPPPLLTTTSTSDSRKHNVQPPRWSPNDVIDDLAVTVRPSIKAAPARRPATTTPAVTTSNVSVTTPPAWPSVTPRPASPSFPVVSPASLTAQTIAARSRMSEPLPEPAHREITQRMDTLQKMILDLGRERKGSALHDIPTELFQVYTQLLDAEVDEDLARELVTLVKQHATRSQLQSPAAVQALLTGLVEQEVRTGSPVQAVRGQRKVVALVGPTGVGKTTTLAKLAANLRLRDNVRVGLITVDTYRIAAVEQLKTYAELIDLPMKVVTSPAEMRQAMDELRHVDVVLIDTAGRSPRDDLKIQELKECLDAAQADEVHLVLSLASGLPTLKSIAANFKTVGVTSLILSKLDEATSAGLLLGVARSVRTPVSYLTTGQNVPDDIEPAHRTRIARLILGQDRINR